MAGVGCTLIVLTGVHLYLSPSLPSVDSLRDIRLQTPLRIYSYTGDLIGEIGEKRRTPVSYDEIPQAFIDALLSAEDAQFYSHNGVSIRGLLRASSQLLISGDIQTGGSTITMQVARNFFLSRRQEFKRKFNEILLALRIERELSKQEILELYVNVIFLGNRAYGIEAAANVYYGKRLSELNLAQLAMIAGMPKAPSTMNPLANPKRALERRNWILGRMLDLGKIDLPTYEEAVAAPVTAVYQSVALDLSAQYVAEMARQKAVEYFGPAAYTDGYRIFTTLRSELQSAAQEAVIEGLLTYDRRHGYRGPERQLPPPPNLADALVLPPADQEAAATEQAPDAVPTKPQTTVITTGDPQTDDDLATWRAELLAKLRDIPTYAGLAPAAVVQIAPKSLVALLKSGALVRVDWDHGLAQARPFITVNRRGPSPKTVADLAQPGDFIRLQYKDKAWHLVGLPEAQGALVSLDAEDGAVLALVGGLDFNLSNFNRVTQAERQPGSSFKPFIYTAALEHGFTPATIINDAPIVFEDSLLENDWRPENASGKFYGPTRLRKALYLSRNLVSIRVLRAVGIDNALRGLGRYGFDAAALPRDLSVALGSFAMTPMEIVRGYSVFANGGYQVVPYFIDRIEDAEGEVVFRSERYQVCRDCPEQTSEAGTAETGQPEPNNHANDALDPSTAQTDRDPPSVDDAPWVSPAPQVLDPRVAYIMDSMLKDVVARGTASKARALKRSDIAGKTGTTNQATDAWFSGYGGGVATVAWVGFDQLATLGAAEFGGTAALPIWIDYMSRALAERPVVSPPRPEGLVTTRINPVTGKRALPGDPDAIFEIFRVEDLPELDEDGSGAQDPWAEDEMDTEDIF